LLSVGGELASAASADEKADAGELSLLPAWLAARS
jgi:hypothetical protein